MTAQLSTKKQNSGCSNSNSNSNSNNRDTFTSTDFIAAIGNISNNNNNNNCFNSEDFQRFLQEHQQSLIDSSSSSDNNSNSSSNSNSNSSNSKANTSLEQVFKSHQFADLFKSQQSFSQMFQSKDSFAELFQSLDHDQKKAFFSTDFSALLNSSSSDCNSDCNSDAATRTKTRTMATATRASSPGLPPMQLQTIVPSVGLNVDATAATATSSKNSQRSASFLQSKDWKNLGTHIDVNYQQSKLFRETSSSFGDDGISITNNNDSSNSNCNSNGADEPDEATRIPNSPRTNPVASASNSASASTSTSSSSKTNWGDFFFAQLQPGGTSTSSSGNNATTAATTPAAAPAATAPTPAPVAPVTAPIAPKMSAPVRPEVPKQQHQRQQSPQKPAHPTNITVQPTRKQGKRYIANPTDTDILMGRGGKSNHHPGNKRYREEILNFKKTYAQLQSKEDKTGLSRHVVDYVHKYHGRFLALDKSVSPPKWYEITDAVARRKVSQALREDGDPVKRQQKRARFLERKRQKEQMAMEDED